MSIKRRIQALAYNPANYKNKLTVELSDWEDMSGLIEFWRYIRNTANGGHSFDIEADRESPNSKPKAKVGVDGDGNDHVGRIFLNDVDVTEDK
jgi:hypothetical protein